MREFSVTREVVKEKGVLRISETEEKAVLREIVTKKMSINEKKRNGKSVGGKREEKREYHLPTAPPPLLFGILVHISEDL